MLLFLWYIHSSPSRYLIERVPLLLKASNVSTKPGDDDYSRTFPETPRCVLGFSYHNPLFNKAPLHVVPKHRRSFRVYNPSKPSSTTICILLVCWNKGYVPLYASVSTPYTICKVHSVPQSSPPVDAKYVYHGRWCSSQLATNTSAVVA